MRATRPAGGGSPFVVLFETPPAQQVQVDFAMLLPLDLSKTYWSLSTGLKGEVITTSSLCDKQMDHKRIVIDEKWIEPDDAPELTDEWFAQAELRRDGKVVRRGRPRLSKPKQQVALRIDPDVIDRFKADGAGWQSRMNEALRKAVGL